MRGFLVLLLLTAVLSAGVCFADENTVLAEIGDKKITQADYNRSVIAYPEEIQKTLRENPELKNKFLLRIVQVELLSGIAREKGIDEIPEVKEKVKMLIDDFFSKEVLIREVVDKIVVTEEDMKSYYRLNKEKYKTPEMVRVRHILIKAPENVDDEKKKESKKKAVEILKRINKGEDFAALALELSEDAASQNKGGDLGFLPRGRLLKPFEDAVFSMKTGEISDVVQTKFGYHIIKLEERKDAKEQSFEEAKEQIKSELFKQYRTEKVEAYVDDAMEKKSVKIYYDRIQLK